MLPELFPDVFGLGLIHSLFSIIQASVTLILEEMIAQRPSFCPYIRMKPTLSLS